MSHLVPLRIDAWSNGTRLIDTLLLDPTCLPRPLPNYPTLHQGVEANVSALVDTFLTDMEVGALQPAGYRSNFYAGRVSLLNVPDLRAKMEQQVRTVLWKVVDDDLMASGSSLLLGGGTNKRKKEEDVSKEDGDEGGADSAEGGEAKKRKLDEEGAAAADANADATEGAVRKDEIDKSDLVKINIRLRDSASRVIVVDEFYIDPNLSSDLSPGGDILAVAQGLVQDLNLPEEMTVPIVTTIVEQCCGLDVPFDVEGMKGPRPVAGSDEERKPAKREAPAAFLV